jgi:arylsulfatase A-like enzyme
VSKNVLLITCDQLRKDAPGCYGNPIVTTPNIDSLARNGVLFDQLYTASPVCAPNRASIATGRYPSVNGLRTNGIVLPESELTLMEVLRRGGYQTYGSGKMHFQPQWVRPEGVGSDPEPKYAIDPQPKPWEFPYYGFDGGAFSEDHRYGPYSRYLEERGYDPWADPHSYTFPQNITAASAYPEEHYQTTWIADRSLDFLRTRDTDRPFFVWTSFVDPHHPFTPPAPWDTMYDPAEMPLPLWSEDVPAQWPDKYRAKYERESGGHEAIGMHKLPDSEWRKMKAYYYGMVSLIDKQVGRLLDELKRQGALEDTVVIFTADHGEMLGDYHLAFKGTMYDCVTNVPFIVAHGGVETTRPGAVRGGASGSTSSATDSQSAAHTCTGLANSIDIMPTTLEIAGLAIPDSVQGRSLVPQLRDPATPCRDEVLVEMPRPVRTIRTPRYRLTVHEYGSTGELYDMESDPNAFRNLWNAPEYRSVRDDLTERLVQLMIANVDPLPPKVGS